MICTVGQVAQAPEFCTVESNNCGSSEWTLLHDTLLASRYLKYFLNLETKNCAAVTNAVRVLYFNANKSDLS
jgi:hypothetical protein